MIDIMKILKAALFTPLKKDEDGNIPWGLTMMLWGEPGVGKSARVKHELCRRWGFQCKTLSPGTDGEGAFGVTPVPNGETMSYPPPYWVEQLGEGGVVFLDEVNQAPPPLQPAIMGIALDRRIGDYVLPHNVRRIAAGNPTEIAAGGWDLAPPLSNRFGHLQFDAPSADEWANYIMGANVEDTEILDHKKEEKRVLAAWDEAWAKAVGVVINFIKARPELLQKMPKTGNKDVHGAWSSARAWENALRAFASAEVHGLSDIEREVFVASFVGEGASSELMAYISQMDLPNPADVLDGKVKFKHDPNRFDRTAAVFSGCAALLAPENAKDRRSRAATFWTLLSQKEIMEEATDVGFIAAKRMVLSKLHTMKEAYKFLNKILPILEEAGIVFNADKVRRAKSGFEV